MTSTASRAVSPTRNALTHRRGSRGKSELTTDSRNTCSPGAAAYSRIRNDSPQSPSCGDKCAPQRPQNAPAATRFPHTGQDTVAIASLPSGAESVLIGKPPVSRPS